VTKDTSYECQIFGLPEWPKLDIRQHDGVPQIYLDENTCINGRPGQTHESIAIDCVLHELTQSDGDVDVAKKLAEVAVRLKLERENFF
jgi:hypothetical protein